MDSDKFSQGAVVSLFNFRREQTARELTKFPVVANALTAFPFPGAWFISAATFGFVVINLALHSLTLHYTVYFLLKFWES